MLCESCKKNRATFHYTHIINNEVSEIHLCSKCALEKGIGGMFIFPHPPLTDLFAGLTQSLQKAREVNMPSGERCPMCGFTYRDFRETGRLGCSKCYSTFRRHLQSMLKKIHGSNQHVGKSVTKMIEDKKEEKVDLHQELLDLREKLHIAVSEEDYEQAAKIRDKIKKIERKLLEKRII